MRRNEEISKMNDLMSDSRKIRNVAVYDSNLLLDDYLYVDDMARPDPDLLMDELPRGIDDFEFIFSKVHQYAGEEFLINVIEMPLISLYDSIFEFFVCDGMLFVIDALDGIDHEMEMVLRQALKANVRPILLIGGIEKLTDELKLDSRQLQVKLNDLISDFNRFVCINADSSKKAEWQLDFDGGSVIFASTENNFALNVPLMDESGLKFDDVIRFLEKDDAESRFPICDAVFDMIVWQVPSPGETQDYRIPELWAGDIESVEGRAMLNADCDGPFTAVIVHNQIDNFIGLVLTFRIISGTLKKGDEVFLVDSNKKATIKHLMAHFGSKTVPVENVPAGNIVSVVLGVEDVETGETLCLASEDIAGFKHEDNLREPAFIMSIVPEKESHYIKLIDFLHSARKQYPHFDFNINEYNGEIIITAISETHLTQTIDRLKDWRIGIKVLFGPDVICKESILTKAGPVETRSPNRHNVFSIEVEPLDECILNALDEGIFKESDFKNPKIYPLFRRELPYDEIRLNNMKMAEKFTHLGMDGDEANRVWSVYNKNMFLDMTDDVKDLDLMKGMIIEVFINLVNEGPLSSGIVSGLKFKLVDAKFHDDAVHKGPAQVMPAVEKALNALIMLADPCLLEPIQKVFVYFQAEHIGECSREIENRYGVIVRQQSFCNFCEMESEIPASKMHGFIDNIKSITEGNGIVYPDRVVGFKRLPSELQADAVRKIRKRKGLSDEPSRAEDYLG